ncbi:MAG: gliding motility-associated C-terminal domain-containing protein [Bacteroidetes bacterium]|nr:gliding motility-associated C-terminal domain-containing protein [Bacteroidota bacterium]
MPRSLFVFCTLLITCTVSAQNGVWTWIGGGNLPNQAPVFGTQTIPAAGNRPPPVYGAASWTDLNGDFWVFGGLDNSAVTSYWGNLWKFDQALGQWAWMKGPNVSDNSGVYGTLGVPSPLNQPGARAFGASTWTDNAGNLWLFGGFGIDATGLQGEMNDFWKFDITTNEWTWMGGSQNIYGAGSFGTLQVPSPANMPSYRSETLANWKDGAGNLWLFGGTYYDDMWRFDPLTNTWTWMAGSNVTGALVVHGTLGVSSPANTPGQRWAYAHWTDQQGKFWLYGGLLNSTTLMGDMWKFDPVTLEWTWMAGSNLPNDSTTFTQQCTPGGYPDATYEGRSFWTDACGRFWNAHGGSIFEAENHIWMFDPVTNQFSWISGALSPATPANFGTQNVPSPANYPLALVGTASFNDLSGNLCLYGGMDANTGFSYNTIWRYQIDPVCPGTNVTAQFNVSPGLSGCAPFTTQFTPAVNLYSAYTWNFGDTATTADTSSLISPVWTYTQPGTYTVTLITSGLSACGGGSDTVSATVTVYPQPQPNLGSDTTICIGPVNLLLDAGNSGNSYLWNTGATTQTLAVNAPGIYSVTVSAGPNGLCSVQDTIVITQPAQPDLGGDTTLCANQSLLLDPGVTGTQYNWSTGATTPTITVNTAGLYSVQIINPPCTLSSSMNLNITPLPIVNLGADTTLCPGDSILLNAQNPGAMFLWSNAANTQSITTATAGNYAVTVTAQNCSNSDTININTSAALTFDETISLCGSFNALILDAGNPGAGFLWNTGENTQTISIEQPGTYWVTVNAPPCVLTDTIEIIGNIGEAAVYIPNSFSPNGDGLNDNFSGYGESFTSFRLLIFNRWGELIFETTDPAGWDGNFNGTKVTDDVYVYKLSYTSACTGGKFVDRLGHVMLLR